jgi:hypothetical protein
MSEHVVSLNSLNSGAALELFDAELKKIIDNIADPNTDPKAKREITLKVVFAPSDDRTQAGVTIGVKSKMSAHRGAQTAVWFGRVDGKIAAVESDPSPGLFDQAGKIKMVPINASKEGQPK